MTIDERLERLTLRHEALTQSVGMLLIEGCKQDQRIDKVGGHIQRLIGNVETLANVVKNHEQRLNGFEGTA